MLIIKPLIVLLNIRLNCLKAKNRHLNKFIINKNFKNGSVSQSVKVKKLF